LKATFRLLETLGTFLPLLGERAGVRGNSILLSTLSSILLLTTTCALAAPETNSFRVGGAYADITPTNRMVNYNAEALVPDQTASPLRVEALVLDDGATRAAVISVDCTMIGSIEVRRLREAVQRKTGLAGSNICIAATHSHATPATTATFLTGALPDKDYLDLLEARTVQAVAQALTRLRPARVVAASIEAPPIAVCRRRIAPNGQVYMTGTEPSKTKPFPAESEIETRMQYAVFVDADNKPLAAMFNFACHNNMVGRVFSADFFGRAAESLRVEFGDIAVVRLAAPCGDVGYRQPGGNRTFPDDRAAGKAIADAVLKSYPTQKQRAGGPLVVRSVTRKIPDRPYDPKMLEYDGGRGTNRSAHEHFKKRYTPEEAALRNRGATECELEFQAIAFGDAAIVTNPAELFSVFGVRIREASPFAVTFVTELANGYCGYVPTKEAFSHGGYETYRTVLTSRLVKDAGDRIERESIELLRAVHR
jgi:neutral ceramidase